MRWLTILWTALACAAAAPAAAQTAEERAQLDWAAERGRLLFEIDRAAWVTTDDLLGHVRDPAAAGVRGWTVEPEGSGYIVTFYAGEGDARAAVYSARVEDRRVVAREIFAEGARPPLTSPQRRLADAREAVPRMDLRACARSPFNAAVIPPAAPDGPVGALGVALTPGRSIAVDRSLHVYGTPFFIQAGVPVPNEKRTTSFNRLMIAQDTGSAIKGRVRGDVFWGTGEAAANVAGLMQSPGTMVALLPRAVAARLPYVSGF